jgi:hypothetical protein
VLSPNPVWTEVAAVSELPMRHSELLAGFFLSSFIGVHRPVSFLD